MSDLPQPLHVCSAVAITLILLACSETARTEPTQEDPKPQIRADEAANSSTPVSGAAGLATSADQAQHAAEAPSIGSIPDPSVSIAAQRASAAAAHGGDEPARLDRFGLPPAFDVDRYRRDPAAYLGRYDARRIRATSHDAAAPNLGLRSQSYQTIHSGASTELCVETLPGMPVTALSTGMGAFDNDLSVITVAADHHGLATVRFTATPGTTGPVNIVIASPVARGTVDVQVDVLPPSTVQRKP